MDGVDVVVVVVAEMSGGWMNGDWLVVKGDLEERRGGKGEEGVADWRWRMGLSVEEEEEEEEEEVVVVVRIVGSSEKEK